MVYPETEPALDEETRWKRSALARLTMAISSSPIRSISSPANRKTWSSKPATATTSDSRTAVELRLLAAIGIIVPMKENEIPIVAGPRTSYMDVLVSALREEHIPARIVAIEDVDPVNRPNWACTPADEVYVVVPEDKRNAALELTRWVSRVCLKCESFLMPKVAVCQKCGTPHPMEPGPHS